MMTTAHARRVTATCLALLTPTIVPAAAEAAQKQRAAERVPGSYIVAYRASVDRPAAKTDRLERGQGFRARFEYRRALAGFAARLTDAQVRALRADPDVAFVSPDRPVRALGSVPLASGDSAPAGVRRMAAATATTTREASTARVAVIDTGIDLAHPDLNAAHGVNCVGAGPAQDDEGHGTHVAGTIAARNDGSGVVGVAPGTPLAAVKVLDAQGSGTYGQIICGIDWVTGTRTDTDAANDVAVANLSLGGIGDPVAGCATTTDPLHRAICASTAAGVTYVVAAGNDGWDFDYAPSPDTPAAYPEVLTVSALSDSDGRPGAAGGSPACEPGEGDDRYATFSNFAATNAGAAHTIAAPGVCVTSTLPGGGHGTMSGTSMATPHVAGAVALCLAEGTAAGPCAGLSPAQIVSRMRSDAAARTGVVPGFGFTGDPLRPVSGRYYGYAAWAGTEQPVVAHPSAAVLQTGAVVRGGAADLAAEDTRHYEVSSTTYGNRTTSWYGRVTGVPNEIAGLRVAYKGKNSVGCTQAVQILNWTSGLWAQLDSRSVGTTKILIDKAVTGTLANYVSGSAGAGEVRVRVRCVHGTRSFVAYGDLLRLTY